jgi:hypothetical protein
MHQHKTFIIVELPRRVKSKAGVVVKCCAVPAVRCCSTYAARKLHRNTIYDECS